MPEYIRRDVYPRLPGLIEEHGPLFLYYSKLGILGSGGGINKAFAPLPHRQYFAVKAAPEPFIMKYLFENLRQGFDCSAIPEIALARGLGARGDDIFYSSNCTSFEEFEYAAKDGGCILNIDDVSFIPLIPVFPKKVCFRINPGELRTGHADNPIGNPASAKYGITYKQIFAAYKAAMSRGAEEFGIHTMICSNERHMSYFVKTAEEMLKVAAMIYKKLGIKIKFINIGGGFGIPYRPEDRELNLDWIGNKITRLFAQFAAEFGWMPTLMTECGRYVTGPHGILVNPVLHVMQKYRHFIGVSAAMTGCPRPAFYGSYHHIDVLDPEGRLRTGPRRFTNVVGPKCENWDRLTPTKGRNGEDKPQERLLPRSIQRGDILVTANTGAHSTAMSDNYNARLRIQALLDLDGTNENTILIRREETMEDLFRTIIFPPGFKLPS